MTDIDLAALAALGGITLCGIAVAVWAVINFDRWMLH